MTLNLDVPWHRESFDLFIYQRLPQLLGECLPLADYQVEQQDSYTFSIKLSLGLGHPSVEVEYRDLPRPDRDGLFHIEGNYRVVVPYPDRRELDQARILCVGEQLYDFIDQRLEAAPEQLAWDGDLVRSWLPLDAWLRDFHLEGTSQYLQATNWLDRYTHLRRLTLIPVVEPFDDRDVFPDSQYGLVCPYCTPEGPNIGRVLEVARGARIRDGKLERIAETPDSILGFSASMVPFLEHDDSNRALMGINMMRQWTSAVDTAAPIHSTGWFRQQYDQRLASKGNKPEPALVQTGYEPEAADFWGGYNLLTAFIMWDGDTFEDGLVISESAAARMNFPTAVGVGDRISNRHGAKGVVTRILPDADMPQLPDGAPIELIFSPTSMVSRLNFGQQREAVMGRLAQAAGCPAEVPPFQAPSEKVLKERLVEAGLPKDGMEQLTLKGAKLPYRSTVGWVYWGRLTHTAAERLETAVAGIGGPQLDMMAYGALCEARAAANIHALFNTATAERPDTDTLGQRLTTGPVFPAPPPAPRFALLQQLLGMAGIRAELTGEELRFSFAEPEGLTLARPVSHPWTPGRQVETVGTPIALPAEAEFEPIRGCYEDLVEANTRLQRIVDSEAPETLTGPAVAQVAQRVEDFFAALLRPEHLHFRARPLFSGRAALASGFELNLDQVGLPEEMAWALFGPQVEREMGRAEEASQATEVLDAIMERSWVLLYSAQRVLVDEGHGPVFHVPPTAVVAFRPRRLAGAAVRVHPRVCRLMELDFDGDQIEVFLPLTEEAQAEAETALSVAGHIQRDADVWRYVADNYHGMIWGLAQLCRTEEGRTEVMRLTGGTVDGSRLFSKHDLNHLLAQVLQREGLQRAMEVLDQLTRRGFEVCKQSGASFNPFLGSSKEWPEQPKEVDWDEWQMYSDELVAAFYQQADFDDNDLGPLALLSLSGARGNQQQLIQYVGGGLLYREDGSLFAQRGCRRDGLSVEEVKVRAPGALWGLAATNQSWTEAREAAQQPVRIDYHVLGRAARAAQPGAVLARAAERGEVDPLTSLSGRLFVGLTAD